MIKVIWVFFCCIAILSALPLYAGNRFGVDLSLLDKKQNPCEDFYQYACGAWLAKTKIPEDRPQWNRSFSAIDENNRNILKQILEAYAGGKKDSKNPYAKMLGDFYGSCIDEKSLENNSLDLLRAQQKEIEALEDLKGLVPLLARFHRAGVRAFFSFGQTQDAKDSSLVIGSADQGGLGLPDREYYLSQSEKMKQIRAEYAQHISAMFGLLQDPRRADAAAIILKLETALAKVSMPRVDRRNPNNLYHRLERAGLIERMPLFDWPAYLRDLSPANTANLEAINITSADFFVGLNQALKDTPMADLQIYLKWHHMLSLTEALPKKFAEERFRFISSALSGQKKMESRWKRCVRQSDGFLGFALSRSFVERAYGEQGKAKSEGMVHELEEGFHHVIQALDWMDGKTKEQAERKLSSMDNKIGYPKLWRSYDGLKIDRKSFFQNLQAAAAFNYDFQMNKIGKPVDKTEWHMTPSTVNAYYDPQKNEIVFPAGILQYPFFDRKSPDSLNYGAIGVVIGHELTHGFDDEGRKFDADGNLKNWWQPAVLEKFEQKTSCVEKEYSAFEALPGLPVNGKLTLGENIADQGGMALAYRAWKSRNSKERSSKGEPSPEQKFFLAFAQSWCQLEQEQHTRARVATDPHSPSRYRVNGVVSQFEPFAQAYECKPGSKMAPIDRCKVW